MFSFVSNLHRSDALDDLESSTMLNAADLANAVSSLVDEHVKGKTRKLSMKVFDEVVVDLEKFARVSGLPLKSPEQLEYTVFLREVTDKKSGGKKIMLVLVKGTTDSSIGDGGSIAALVPMMARLEARAGSGFEPGASFHARELGSGWQLFHNARFEDLLGWWKNGYHYQVSADVNQGLRISY